jgi:hypothetical protein
LGDWRRYNIKFRRYNIIILKSNLRNGMGMSIAWRNLDSLVVFNVDHAESEVPSIRVSHESGKLGTNMTEISGFHSYDSPTPTPSCRWLPYFCSNMLPPS